MTRFIPFASTIWTVIRSSKEDPRGALDGVAKLYRAPVVSYLRAQGVSAEEAEDLSQEVFLRIFQKELLSRVERSKGRFRSFLLGVTNNILREHRERSRAKKRGMPIALEVDVAAPDERTFTHGWMLHLLRTAMERIAESVSEGVRRDLEIFRGSLAARASHADLASRYSVSATGVKNALYRTKQRLRSEVAKLINAYAVSPEDFREELAAFDAESAVG